LTLPQGLAPLNGFSGTEPCRSFLGLRSGGGNFGIVTSFEFDLYPVREIFGGFVIYLLAEGKQALSTCATSRLARSVGNPHDRRCHLR
jgi:hypothetical protein